LRLPGVEAFYPLSPMQHGMLFHSLSAPRSGMYWQQATLTLEGPLDIPSLGRAWERVIECHPVLRTYFLWEGLREPVQVVRRQVSLPVDVHDWRGASGEEQEVRLETLLSADRARDLDLSKAPLARLAVVRLADQLHHVVWSFHHILLDGWSVYRIFKEAFVAYEALRQGKSPEWEPSRPYQDYIAWLRRQDLSRAERFWRGELHGFSDPPSVVSALAASGDGSASGDGADFHTEAIRLDEATSAALQALARQHQLTLNTLLQGAWAILLSRYSGESDVCFGGTVSGRPAELDGVESSVGLFINTLPVRVRVPARAHLLSWLKGLQDRQAEARQYEWTPLVEIQGWSAVPRDQSLFDTILIFANYPVDFWTSAWSGSLKVTGYRTWESTNYAVNAFAEPGPRTRLGAFYDGARCDVGAIGRLLGHWRTLLEGMIASPHARLSDLPLLAAEEMHQALVEWNATTVEDPREAFLPELFEAQAARTPDAVAAEIEGREASYRELNDRAGRLAGYLQALGAGPGVLVGIFMKRSLEMLVALLGVLKAGAAYVPLDPAYPSERVAFMLEDSGLPLLLTQSALVGALPPHRARIVTVDSLGELPGGSALPTGQEVTGEDLAYVIYTSGSTGRPKGVQIPHRALANFLGSMRREPGMTADDVLLSVTTLSFDIAGLELYLPLVVGGRVVLASREEASDGARLLKRLRETRATLMQATPATWRLLLAAGWQREDPLKILCGGEALPRELVGELLERGSSVWNMYGPTETTIWSAVWRVEPAAATVSIGRPIANTRIYVLDPERRPVPLGVTGELHIGGDGLARGYLNRPDLTAEKFIPDPFSAEPGGRLYGTGDLARYLPDGTVECFGRVDHQVKIRGFRIELGEIEAVLSRHAAVGQAAALVREDVPGDRRLVCYVVSRAEPDFPSRELGSSRPALAVRLRRFLQEALPDYMVPAIYVFLDAMPLTPNGKVDRRALPKPEAPPPDRAGSLAPRTAAERAIAAIWQDVLRVDNVGLHDNFFDSGGHSLLLMQVQSRLRQSLKKDLPITDLFRYPTVSALGRHLMDGAGGEEAPPAENAALRKVQEGKARLDRLHHRRQRAREER